MAKVLVTGAAGFLGGYVVDELLTQGHEVIGVDNLSKYGQVIKSYDNEPRYSFVKGDAGDPDLMKEVIDGCEFFIAAAAMIGGISYFHAYPYDLLASNERIIASACDAAIQASSRGALKKIVYVSSSMVYESAHEWPSSEGQELMIPPPRSSYGFQKLAGEYFVRSAYEQYGLYYTIVRPFNCVGIGERRALGELEITSGNLRLAMSHVVPDLAQKILRGQDPIRILGDGNQIRNYTYGGDVARGIVSTLDNPLALNEDFNISSSRSTTVLELAKSIWIRVRGDAPFRFVSDQPFEHDVQRRIPSVEKAERLLSFVASTSLDDMLDEVIPWVAGAIRDGLI